MTNAYQHSGTFLDLKKEAMDSLDFFYSSPDVFADLYLDYLFAYRATGL